MRRWAGCSRTSTWPDQDEELGCDTVSGDLNGALRSINEPLIIDDKLAAAQCLLDTVPVGGARSR